MINAPLPYPDTIRRTVDAKDANECLNYAVAAAASEIGKTVATGFDVVGTEEMTWPGEISVSEVRYEFTAPIRNHQAPLQISGKVKRLKK